MKAESQLALSNIPSHKKISILEFLSLLGVMLFSRVFDWYFTYKYSPDLKFEANPMVSLFNFQWLEFIFLSLFLILLISFCQYYDLFLSTTKFPDEKGLSFSEFASLLWFGRKRHFIFYLIAFAKDWDMRIRYIGYAGSRLLPIISFIAGASWIGISEYSWFEKAYSTSFPIFPYGLIIVGAPSFLFLFLRREYEHYVSAT